ncbi:MAG: transporter substrate-binding domain-containing protein [Brevinema sp.]
MYRWIMGLVVSIMLGACGNPSNTKSIVVGVNAEYMPFEYREGDKIVGFNVDMIRAVLDEAGYSYTFADMNFDGLLPALQSKKVDMVIGVQATDDRRMAVDFSDIYVSDRQVLVINKDNVFALGNYQGLKIAAQLGTMQEQVARSFEGAEVVTYPSYTAAILDLNAQKIDGIVVGVVASAGYIKENPSLMELGTVSDDPINGYAFAISKDATELKAKLNEALAVVKQNGTTERLRLQYLGF